jgi:S-adenosylmethionine:tRNA ribosyltransferase-isomerase
MVSNCVQEEGGFVSTNLFIHPGYQFKIIDRLLTNFHQPESTPLFLTSAFAGKEFLFSAYREAIEKKYRLFSYGDCMFLV